MRKRRTFPHIQLIESAPGLALSSADVDCAVSVITGDLIARLVRIVDGIIEETVAIKRLPAIGVGDSKRERL